MLTAAESAAAGWVEAEAGVAGADVTVAAGAAVSAELAEEPEPDSWASRAV